MNIQNKLTAIALEANVPVAIVTSHYNHALTFLEKHTSCFGDEAVKVAIFDTEEEYKYQGGNCV